MVNPFWINEDHFKPVGSANTPLELANALTKCKINVIKHHTQDGKNDFADWLEKEVGDKEKAERIRNIKARNPSEFKKKLIEELKK